MYLLQCQIGLSNSFASIVKLSVSGCHIMHLRLPVIITPFPPLVNKYCFMFALKQSQLWKLCNCSITISEYKITWWTVWINLSLNWNQKHKKADTGPSMLYCSNYNISLWQVLSLQRLRSTTQTVTSPKRYFDL